jgi:hypothetical protein
MCERALDVMDAEADGRAGLPKCLAEPHDGAEGRPCATKPVAFEFRGGCNASSRNLVDCRKASPENRIKRSENRWLATGP